MKVIIIRKYFTMELLYRDILPCLINKLLPFLINKLIKESNST